MRNPLVFLDPAAVSGYTDSKAGAGFMNEIVFQTRICSGIEVKIDVGGVLFPRFNSVTNNPVLAFQKEDAADDSSAFAAHINESVRTHPVEQATVRDCLPRKRSIGN